MNAIAFPENISGRHILCLGDVMLDHFHSGVVARISPEAPVPVFKQTDTITMPGGAANTACNIASLGAAVTLVAPVGNDQAGRELRYLIEDGWGIRLAAADDQRGTIVKARYSALGQQLLRIDNEDLRPPALATREALSNLVSDAIAEANLVVLSDYAKGALDEALCQEVITRARSRGIPVVVDPKGSDFSKYRGATLVTPNEMELSVVVGRVPADEEEIIELASTLARTHDFGSVAVTRGKSGVMLVGRDGLLDHVPSFALDVFDVSGAGDSFVAGVACSLATGAGTAASVRYGNAVAGVAVGKVGTAVVTQDEVERVASDRDEKPLITSDYKTAERIVAGWSRSGAQVGFTNGVFDLLHLGHLRTFKFARQHCNKLVVAINSDASVKRLKGDSRPIQSDEVRAEVLANLQQVDLVVVFNEDTPIEVIKACVPDLLVKGGDYCAEDVVGYDVVTGHGGRVMIVPTLNGYSTTSTIGKMQDSNV